MPINHGMRSFFDTLKLYVILAWVPITHGAAPVFSLSSYSGTVDENVLVDTIVNGITLSATVSGGGNVTYSIISSAGPFKLSTNGTKVLTNGLVVNFEAQNSYILTVQAESSGETATASVTIAVNDVNEAPTFTLSSYSGEIAENSAPGVDIITITAADPDGGDKLNYTLSGPDSSLFSALSNGIIEVAGSLDFETTPSYSLTLTATDSGFLTDTTVVVISVRDVNERPSFIGAPYSAIVPENDATASVVTVAANDPDIGDSVTYSLSGAKSSDFTIHPASGVVALNNALNYESFSLYLLTVTASDGNGYGNGSVTSTSLTVTVTNRNDAPVSLSNSYSATIGEDEPGGTNVLKTGASDEDGHNILFSLSGSSDFDILNSGMIRIKSGVTLDYETQDSYGLTVEFSDSTANVSKFVSITVLDRNDAPTLPNSPYSTSVSENVSIGTSVFVVNGSDQDGDSLVYSLSGAGATHFTIDSNTGAVTTSQALNYEDAVSHFLNVHVSDGKGGRVSTSLTISVTDANDAPQFLGAPYTAAIDEGLSSGLILLTASAVDDDSGDTLQYSLLGTNNADFVISNSSGVISTAKSLNYETVTSYALTVSVEDGKTSVTTSLTITVNDKNDAPVFRNASYATAVDENDLSAPVFTVSATDQDSSDSLWYIFSGSVSADFVLDSSTGLITLSRPLNYESTPSYSLSILVLDGNGESSSTNLQVTVNDLNESPRFVATPYSVSIDENLQAGFHVVQVIATDEDSGDSLTYFLSGEDSSHFEINPLTGLVTTTQPLDRETVGSYAFLINVTDGITSVTEPLLITVLDKNDVPSFTAGTYTTSVVENDATASVYTINATDQDSGDSLTFTLTGSGSADFSLNPMTGVVTLTRALDFEATPVYYFTVTASDSNGGVATKSLNVTVVNQNDMPQFEGAPYSVNIDENLLAGTTVIKVQASDEDASDTLSYSLSGTNSNHFSISSSTGVLTTAQALDRENISSYLLDLSVSDGNVTVFERITINVDNANDAPTFSNAPYNVSVDENVDSGNLFTVSATDEDGDAILFTLDGVGSELFSVHSSSGVVSLVEALDYESVSGYTLTIRASDSYGGVAVTSVYVKVVDRNDGPAFVGTPYIASVNENVAIGITVIDLMATDQDGDALTFSLTGSDDFNIGTSNGIITTNQVLDHETNSSYSLIVRVSDGPTTVSQPLTISIRDVNDPPLFSGAPYAVSVNENEAVSAVYTVSATDQDAGDSVTFLLAGPGSADFFIHPNSGVVSLNQALDYESLPFYLLTVIASDTNGGMVQTTLNVTVVDQNDSPAFVGLPFSAQINENQVSGSFVLKLTATDQDAGDSLTFSIEGSNSDHFAVSSNGHITTTKVLDFESVNTYSLNISVSDGKKDVKKALIITVRDTNDSPVFVNSPYAVTLSENNASAVVSAVSVIDEDSGDTLTFFLSGEGSGDFSILSSTGLVSLNRALDYESKSSYVLTVTVRDGYGGQATSSFIVTVSDENDAPSFIGTPYSVSLDEDVLAGTIVLQASAVDEDSSDIVEYSFSGENSTDFSIATKSGIITTAVTLDFELISSYSLTVSVTDGTASVSQVITISITDKNDAPTFVAAPYSVTVAENTTTSTLFTVSATDQDTADSLNFLLLGSGSELFSMHPTSGVLALTTALDYEVTSLYTLTVFLADNNGAVTTTSLSVSVSDVNDSPLFLGTPYTATISENLPSGSDVIKIAANDADGDVLSYSLSGKNNGSFMILSPSGLIETTKELDFEAVSSYSLTVSVSDGKISISTALTISVIDVNDAPYVTNLPTNISLFENDVTVPVIDVNATDPDGDNITFSLSGSRSDDFNINPATGRMTLTKPLNFESQALYSLTVRVSDGIGGVAVASLTVIVVNQNDLPVILGAPFTTSMDENLNGGIAVYKVVVTDEDTEDSCIFSLSGTNSNHFAISAAGVITTAQKIDFEAFSSYTLTTTVFDGTETVNTTLTITVVDRNDPPQIVNAPYTVTVDENDASATLVNVTAMDMDSGPPDTLTFSLYGAGSSYLSIHPNTGVVSLSQALDFEQFPQIVTTVEVRDGRGGLATTSLTVDVNDRNDAPVFQGTPFSTVVSENVPDGSTVLQITAYDQDSNDTLTYTLSGANSSYFQMSSLTGLILTARELDYEVLNYFFLTVSVSDGRTTATQPLTITITDKNDLPMFSDAPYSVQINENFIYSSIVLANATDPDNDTLRFTLSGSRSSQFTIHPLTGLVSITEALNFEEAAMYVLTLTVSDGKGGVNDTTLTVEVVDHNDPPTFVNTPFSAAIDENIDIGTIISQASATDEDNNTTLTYSLSGANSSVFAISTTGIISTVEEIDFESCSLYSLTLWVGDGATTVSSPLTVTVNDINDIPVFTNAFYSLALKEGTGASVSILQVSASDQDGENIAYSFVGITSTDFTINSANGVVATSVVLDYEKTPSYVLNVQANDGNGGKTLSNVIVNVIDLNDETPLFNSASYNGHVTENVLIGSSVMTVTASDRDTADSSLAYALSGANSSHFTVTSNGLIQTGRDIDYESIQGYSLTLTATDNANNTGTTVISITVVNVNDNDPIFSAATLNVDVSEGSAPSTSVARVTATDGDLDDIISYALSGADSIHFTVNENTGVVSTTAPLDRESQDLYSFTLTVTDSGGLSSLATINVTVNDVNDNNPVCATAVYAASVAENEAVGSSLVTVSCSDLDVGSNGEVTYSILSGDGGVFAVNSSTGVVTISSPLDHESAQEYLVTLQATDAGSPPLSSTTTVILTITGVNEFTPHFIPNNSFAFTAAESLALGHDIITVSANDADAGSQGEVTYTISGGDTYGNFVIDRHSGVIELVSSLDHEVSSQITLTVTATDGDSGSPLFTQATVTVNVVDVNDNHPECLPTLLAPAVLESAVTGDVVATLNCSDQDSGSNGQLSYTISTGNSDGKFNISSSGEVSVTDTLDYETVKSYHLSITVTDGGVTPMSTEVSVTISVSPVNEYAPVFTSSGMYLVSVPEDISLGTEVIRVTANDGDDSRHAHGRLIYSLISGNTGFFFHISAYNGAIQLVRSLDREVESSYVLIVKASDGENHVNATVSITVVDSNDNQPICSPSSYSAAIREDVGLGTSVLTVTCSDDDEGVNGLLVYSIISGNTNNSFTINSNGTLSTAAWLDYETMPAFTLSVRARDSSSPSSSQKATVMEISLDVTAVNEHKPLFDFAQYTTSITEKTAVGTSIIRSTARDQDYGPQGDVSYSMTPPSAPFYIDSNSGVIRVKTSLDRETVDIYILTVTASDKDPNIGDRKSSSVNVTVTLTDVNDNDPVFSPDHYKVEFYENTTAGSSITQLQCTDQDLGTNSVLVYSITDGDPDGFFNISSSTGRISSAKHLDFEDVQSYSLTVEARDSSSPISSQHASLSHVDVVVTPLNEHTPVFSQSSYDVTISENTAIGASILSVIATDSDSGSQGELTFALSSGSPFGIDEVSGVVRLQQELDFEVLMSYSLLVTATDGDLNSPKSLGVNLTVTLRDENDNAPMFSPTLYSVTIPEDAAVFTNILNLTCADADSGTNGQFLLAITSGNTGTGFSISDEGFLNVASALDAETTSFYSLEITATDRHPSQPLSNKAKVTIIVTDVNEHTPQFTDGGSYTTLLTENATVGALVSSVSATDLDIGSVYGVVSYAIASGNADGTFAIRPTDGVVFVKRPLDRETTGSYNLTIKASDQDPDSPLSSTATLQVTLTDINDNPPICVPCIHGLSIKESVTIGTTVVQLNCSDADLSPNVISAYTITTGNTTAFGVNGDGLVTTLVTLDFEAIESHLLVVTVSDGGSPQLTTNVTVSIQVTGANEFSPVFSNSTYTVSHSEDIVIGTAIATVAAADRDHGPDGTILFALIDGDSEGRFQIDPKSGVIELRKQLDRETTEVYSLTIRATDQGVPSLSSTVTVHVKLLDVNDNPPLCNHSSYVIELAENFTVNGTVLHLQCSDADEGENSAVSYNISSGNTNSTFNVNSKTGILFLSVPLNLESQAYHDLIITVRDNGSPQLSTQVTAYIVITAINEFAPIFTQNGFYNLSIPEDTSVGTSLVRVQAQDEDRGKQGMVSYSISLGNEDGMFFLDGNLGTLILRKPLDHETRSQYSLTVRASDNAPKPLTKWSFATVNITILDLNDNAPLCSQSAVVVSLMESTVVGTVVFTPNCTDVDSSSLLSYQISEGNHKGNFNVSSAEVRLNGSLNIEDESLFNLLLTVSDSGSPMKHAYISLTVKVLPVNEHEPTFVANDQLYNLDVLENITLGTVVFQAQVIDNDTGIHGDLRYVLVSGNGDNKFYLDEALGRLVLVKSLDRETTDQYNISLRVDDSAQGSPDAKCSNVTVYISVSDVNDNSPVCSPALFVKEIPEDISLDANVTAIACSDEDLGPNGNFSFEIVSGNFGNKFRLDDNRIVVNDALDHENGSEYGLEIYVTDHGVPNNIAVVMVTVYVKAKNEFTPIFQYPNYTVNISETTAIGSQVFHASATDSDEGLHGELEYSITGGLDGGIDFTVDLKEGQVFVGAELDRETRDLYVLNLTVKDRASKESDRRFSTMKLVIHISDENDNPPVFTQGIYTGTIPENVPSGFLVTQVNTTDADIGINAEHTFTITGGDGVGKFSINSSSGVISARSGLDRETKDTYYLSITAQDGGTPPLTGLCAVRVFISDTNDHKPVFSPALYLTSISEATSSGTDVIPVHAHDKDAGINARIDFSIVGGDPKKQFQVNSAGMISIKNSLDREEIPFYTLLIQASDQGIPPLTETVFVNVTIEDVNDNPPVFSDSNFTVTVAENLPVGSRFLNVTASDSDIGDNAVLTWSIVSGNTGDVMAIESSSGILFNLGSFDRETTPEYLLTVRVKDAGNPPLNSSTKVRVRISDSNDNSPEFSEADYTFFVVENHPIGTSVGEVQANDIDNGTHAQLVYSIESGDEDDHFSINQVQGTIYTAVVLDREDVREYRIRVKASDSAVFPSGLSTVTNVYITVLDQNDNRPSFPQPFYNASVPENSPSGVSVTTVTAKDLDSDANAELTYSITHESSVGYFSINSATGEVFVRSSFDYEAVKFVNVTITAQDNGIVRLNSSVSMKVYIEDVNDNFPVFEKDFYDALIRHDRSLDSAPIVTVSATDKDSGDMGTVEYNLLEASSVFTVGRSDGNIRLSSSPEIGKKYVLRLRATDQGTPPLTSGIITVRIDVIDPENTMVDIELEITLEQFEANRELFLEKISKLLGAEVGISEIVVITEEARRRKRETKTRLKVTIYAVKNPTGNTTDLNEKLSHVKDYMTRDDILSVLLDEDGNLNPNLTNDKELEVFNIRTVKATKRTIPPPVPFFKTTVGIISLVFGCFAVLLAIASVVYWKKRAKKRLRLLESREPNLRPHRDSTNTEVALHKGKDKRNKMISPVMADDQQIVAHNGKRFDGRAVDPATGKVYLFNKTTGERMWLKDLREERNGPQSLYNHRQTHSRYADRQHYRVQDIPPPRASIEKRHEYNNRSSHLQLPGTPEGHS